MPCALESQNLNEEGRASQIFLLLLQTLVLKYKELADPSVYPKDYSDEFKEGKFPVTFDFIIVGGGTSGTILANRLSENPKWNILLLEAGTYPSKVSEVPLLQPTLKGTKEDWAFEAEEKECTCLGSNTGRCNMFQGKVLGGTTVVSPNLYGRALQFDWNDWAVFNKTWRHEYMMTIFRRLEKIENSENPAECLCSLDFEKTGEIPLKPYDEETELKKYILEISQRLSAGRMTNNRTWMGYLDVPVISEERRTNFAKIFLSPIKDRKNLYLSLQSTAEKVLFTKPPDNKAVATIVNIRNSSIEIKAKREVILAAGAINSAKILLQSGIGPKNQLEKAGINVIKSLEVGQNLHSHYIVPVFIRLDFETTKHTKENYAEAVFDYLMNSTGLLINIDTQNFIGYISTNKKATYPTIGVHHDYFPKNNTFLLRIHNSTWQYSGSIMYSLKKNLKKHGIFAFSLELLKPLSRGYVDITNENCTSPPVVQNNFFSNRTDADELVKAYKFIIQLVKAPKMKKMNATVLKLNMPACRCFKFNSDEYIRCYVMNMGYPTTSVVGTAKAGSASDNTTVVNEELVVHGFRCFRVVDGSVLPTITTQSTTGTIAAIADRTSELIKNKWSSNKG